MIDYNYVINPSSGFQFKNDSSLIDSVLQPNKELGDYGILRLLGSLIVLESPKGHRLKGSKIWGRTVS